MHLAALLDHHPAPILQATSEGEVRYANLAGQTVLARLRRNPTQAASIQRFWAELYRLNRTETLYVTLEGYSFTFQCIPDAGQHCIHIYGMQDDEEHHHAKSQLRAQEHRFRALFEQTNDAIFLIDLDQRILAANQQAADLLGYGLDELIGSSAAMNVPPPAAQTMAARWQTLLAQDRLPIYESWLMRRDGRRIPVEISAALVRDDYVAPLHVQSIVRDVSERKQAERAIQKANSRLTSLIANLQAGILVEDEARRLVLVNQTFCAMFHIPLAPTDLVGMDCRELAEQAQHSFTDPAAFLARIEVVLSHQQAVLGDTLHLVDGRILERDYIPVFNDEYQYLGHMWQYNDVTERAHYEATLAAARDEALEASRLKSEFLATMSHEMRTPMNGILGMTELLLETALDAEQRDFATIVLSEAENLLRIINNVLDFSKIEASKLILAEKEFSILELIDSIMAILKPEAVEKNLALHVSIDATIPKYVMGDALRLRQVLLNLVGNAIKFTPQGEVTVHVEHFESHTGAVHIGFSVQDTGIGIPLEAQERIFHSFSQVDGSHTRRFGGTGLGLAIAKRLVELMGGQITLHSEPGRGSLFAFDLWLMCSTAAKPVEHTESTLPLMSAHMANGQKRILLVEDHHTSQALALKQLSLLGYTGDLAEDGAAALARVQADPARYAAILMDCQMPHMDGFEATERIRAAWPADLPPVVIIAMTASAMHSDRQRCLAVGMDDYISKPVSLNNLREVLGRWVRAR